MNIIKKLIIFDCDGTLVDSEYLHNKTLADMLADHGLPQYTVEYNMENFVGLGLPTVMKNLEDKHDMSFPDDFTDSYVQRVIDNADEHMKPADSVQDIIAACHAETRICLVSNGERPVVLSFVDKLGLSPYFPEDKIVTPDMVENPKPAPDMLLMAAEAHGTDPEDIIVIEDSVTGIKAAQAANMAVIAVTGLHEDPESHARTVRDAGADIVVDQLIHIRDHL